MSHYITFQSIHRTYTLCVSSYSSDSIISHRYRVDELGEDTREKPRQEQDSSLFIVFRI